MASLVEFNVGQRVSRLSSGVRVKVNYKTLVKTGLARTESTRLIRFAVA